MGCDIHAHAERKVGDKWEEIGGYEPFDNRDYSLFGFLAGVRNYSGVTPISGPRGVPADVSESVREAYEGWGGDAHSASWLSLQDLLGFDYDAETEDRRVTRNGNGGCTCEPGEGKKMPWREFLGQWYFKELDRLKETGADRIVFYFDN